MFSCGDKLMAWAPQGGGWGGAPSAQDELALRVRQQLALRGMTGSDSAQLAPPAALPPGLASDQLLAQNRQPYIGLQGSGLSGIPFQGGVNLGSVKPARLPLGAKGTPALGPGVCLNVGSPGLAHTAQPGLGRIGFSTAGLPLGADGLSGTSVHSFGAQSAQSNQAALLALMQSQLTGQMHQHTGTIPAVPSVLQPTATLQGHVQSAGANQANLIAAAAATAAAQVANMRNAAALAARTTVDMNIPKRQAITSNFQGIGVPGQRLARSTGVLPHAGVQMPGVGLQNGLQSTLGAQLSLAGAGLQLQLARNASLGAGAATGPVLNNGRTELGLGSAVNFGNTGLGVLGQGITSQAGAVGSGGLQTAGLGLQPQSLVATAPMLPILGEDLARPNVQNHGVGNISSATLASVPPSALAIQSATSLDSSSVKSSDTVMTVASSAGSPQNTPASEAQAVKVKTTDGPTTSAPMGALDVSTLTQSQVSALLNAQTDSNIRQLAAQFSGLLGQTTNNTVSVSGGPVVGVPASGVTSSGNGRPAVHCERDMSTLKTLGQMLARTGNTVESAVQTGLLGGCNAEDVKVVWDAFAVELAGMKQVSNLGTVLGTELPKGRHLGTSVVPKASENLMTLGLPNTSLNSNPADSGKQGVIGDKRGIPMTTTGSVVLPNMPAPIGPPTDTSLGQSGVPVSTNHHIEDKRTDEEEEEPNWDEVFENEEELVPSHVISAVNDENLGHLPAEVRAKLEGVYDAFSYGFFGSPGEENCGGELLESGDEDTLEKGESGDIATDCTSEQKTVGEDEMENEPGKEALNVGMEHRHLEELRTTVSGEACCGEGENAVPANCVGSISTCSL